MSASITIGSSSTITVTLRNSGSAVSIPPDAAVFAQFYTTDGVTHLSGTVSSSRANPLGNWDAGIPAFTFSSDDTSGLIAPSSLLLVTLVIGGVSSEWRILFSVIDPTQAGSALFPVISSAVASMRSEYAAQLSGYVDISRISDVDLFAKIRAAESDASHQLRAFFAPTVVIPEDAPQAEVDALEEAGTRFVQEPAYDYDPDFFMGERWGYIVANHRPLISVQSIRFAYPDPTHQVWDVPIAWVRTDKQFGHIRLVPAAQSFSAPLSAFVMQALGGGRTIPFMIQVRYTAGLANPARDYPELLDLVKKMAALRILQSAFLPQSGSISADGLSQSSSVDVEKWHDGIVDKLGDLRDAIHGVRMMVV